MEIEGHSKIKRFSFLLTLLLVPSIISLLYSWLGETQVLHTMLNNKNAMYLKVSECIYKFKTLLKTNH